MTNRLWQTAVERVGVLTAPLAFDEMTDGELLRRFVATREECAFAAMVRRHGSLVWAVCRSLMPSEADAEDAFQATFLVLVRSAAKVRKPNALGAWLHTVAGRVCRNGLRTLARRRKHERSAAIIEADQPVDGAAWDRWQAIAHEEIDRLPETLRVPFVLCVMQGMRQQDAAERLGWKLGTVSGRICKAKQLLSDAITRRGLVGPAVLAAALGGASSPLAAGLATKGTLVAVRLSEVSTIIHELARGAMGGVMSKVKLLAAIAVVGLGVGVGTSVLSTADAQTAPPGAGGGGSAPKSGTTPPPGFPGAPPGPPMPGGPGAFPPGSPPGPSGAPGGGFPGSGNPFGGGTGGGFASVGPKVEYQFVAKPKNADTFKKLLAQHGTDGWEYVGVIPDGDELIFKRHQRTSGFGGMGGGMGMGPMGGGGFGTAPGLPKGGTPSSPGTGAPGLPGPSGMGPGSAGRPGPGGGEGGLPGRAGPGGGDGGPGAGAVLPTVQLKVGETIRHKMSAGTRIDRIFNHDNRIAEVIPDPTDARRVLIKGLGTGAGKLDLTDSDGAFEVHQIRVK